MTGLKNTYWLLRHGRSLANEAGIVISQRENGIKPEYALAPVGQEQAVKAGHLLRQHLEAAAAACTTHAATVPLADAVQLHVYCSPFSRTIETATLAAAQAGLSSNSSERFQTRDALMERNFGVELEGKSYHGAYERLWAGDAVSVDSKLGDDGETLLEVSTRIKQLFSELEAKHSGCHLLLVAHGDTLSILQATMEDADIKQHRRYAFETAELRLLGSGPVASDP